MEYKRKSDLLLAEKIKDMSNPDDALKMLLSMYDSIQKHKYEGYVIRAYRERGYTLELKDIKL